MNGAATTQGARALGDAITTLLQAPVQMATALAGSLARRGSPGCEIPPPCWEPRLAGTCSLVLPPDCPGTVRVYVTNCDWRQRVIGITALGKVSAWLTFQPTTLVLGPQERAAFTVTVRPTGAKPGQALSGPILVRGCVDHWVRLEVRVAECAGGNTCCDVHVHDCADHIHHWYDHFYCPRPCRNPIKREAANG